MQNSTFYICTAWEYEVNNIYFQYSPFLQIIWIRQECFNLAKSRNQYCWLQSLASTSLRSVGTTTSRFKYAPTEMAKLANCQTIKNCISIAKSIYNANWFYWLTDQATNTIVNAIINSLKRKKKDDIRAPPWHASDYNAETCAAQQEPIKNKTKKVPRNMEFTSSIIIKNTQLVYFSN